MLYAQHLIFMIKTKKLLAGSSHSSGIMLKVCGKEIHADRQQFCGAQTKYNKYNETT